MKSVSKFSCRLPALPTCAAGYLSPKSNGVRGIQAAWLMGLKTPARYISPVRGTAILDHDALWMYVSYSPFSVMMGCCRQTLGKWDMLKMAC